MNMGPQAMGPGGPGPGGPRPMTMGSGSLGMGPMNNSLMPSGMGVRPDYFSCQVCLSVFYGIKYFDEAHQLHLCVSVIFVHAQLPLD